MPFVNDLHVHEESMMEYQINPSIDEIIRGEISAVETYEQVLKEVENDPESLRLEKFLDQHAHAVNYWQRQVKRDGLIPESSSSIWGTAVEAFVGVSKLLGNTTALRALIAGEEHGLKNYQSMLEDENLTLMQKKEIRDTFIPRQRQHIETLESLINIH